VKRSGRDESVWFAIHMCMEEMLGIFLYSYLHLKLAKCYTFLIFSSTKLENKRMDQVLPGTQDGGWEGGPNNVYTCE
jgi:hypothetical protein